MHATPRAPRRLRPQRVEVGLDLAPRPALARAFREGRVDGDRGARVDRVQRRVVAALHNNRRTRARQRPDKLPHKPKTRKNTPSWSPGAMEPRAKRGPPAAPPAFPARPARTKKAGQFQASRNLECRAPLLARAPDEQEGSQTRAPSARAPRHRRDVVPQ